MESIPVSHSTEIGGKRSIIDIPTLAKCSYSIQSLLRSNSIPRTNLFSAIKKSMELFNQAGINVRHHFTKTFIVDETASATYIDWLLTKRAMDLIIKHCSILKLNAWIVFD